MSNIIEFPNREQVYDQASLWIARLDRQLTTAEEQALRHWLAENDEHKTVFLEMAQLWDKMDSLSRLADLFQAPKPQQQTRFTHGYFAIAASIAIAALALVMNFSSLINNPFSNQHLTLVEAVYETPIGQHNTMLLPDGSRLMVNTNSRVRVQYTADARLFFLERGELNIEVAKDASRPLSVIARNKIVQAVGTAFNVRIHNEDHVELLVTHGKVLVAQQTEAKNSEQKLPKRLPTNSLAVSSGEKILLGSTQKTVAKIDAADVAAELSWREGNLVFRGETLEQALKEISRYTAMEFEIQDEQIKQQRIAGLFKAGDVDGLLAALDQNFHIRNQRLSANRIRLLAETDIQPDSK
jgi:transmembrane sensor